MIYGYIRVSTDKQDTANQRYEIEKFCSKNGISIEEWVNETISSRVDLQKRKLAPLLRKMKKDDLLIASEISRLGRNLMQIMSILHGCLNKEVQVWTIKDNYRLGNDISSKVLAFAFGLSAEIERNLISQRVKEALARKKSEGMILGRPPGSKKKNPILKKHDAFIRQQVAAGASQISIARKLKVHRHTVKDFIATLKN
jgi:DNA invertase Pin-like site-specific DNA recombinase